MAQLTENTIDLPELREKKQVFAHRPDAGLVLATMLEQFRDSPALILAIPAGGVPVALSMALTLNLPISVAVVSKITLPWNTESGYGAVAFDGTVRLNEKMLSRLDLTEEQVNEGIKHTTEKVRRRVERFAQSLPLPDLKGKTLFLVDDGLASGFTMLTAVEAVKKADPGFLNIAVPTAHLESIERISPHVDAVYCPNVRSGLFFAVADAYQIWSDVDEKELFKLISKKTHE